MFLFLEHLTFSQLPDVYRLLLQRLSIKRYHFQQKNCGPFRHNRPAPSTVPAKRKKGRRFFFARARSRLGDAAPAIHSAREGVFPVEPKGTAGTAPRRHHEEHMEIRQAPEQRSGTGYDAAAMASPDASGRPGFLDPALPDLFRFRCAGSIVLENEACTPPPQQMPASIAVILSRSVSKGEQR